MITKRKIFTVLTIIVVVYALVMVALVTAQQIEYYGEELLHWPFIEILLMFILLVVRICREQIVILLLLMGVWFGIRAAERDNFSKIDFEKYEGYYREKIRTYSPAVLSYVDDLAAEPDKDVAATLLGLQLKGYVAIADNKITVLEGADPAMLDANERYVLENIGKINPKAFAALVVKDAEKSRLVKPKKGKKGKISDRIFLLVMAWVMSFMGLVETTISLSFKNKALLYLGSILMNIFIVAFFTLPVFIILYYISYRLSNANITHRRTKEGEKINEMLEGLKNYTKDFTLLDERSKKELTLWEVYLIYSVLFGQNKAVVEDLRNAAKN